jgi:hypothetical protein
MERESLAAHIRDGFTAVIESDAVEVSLRRAQLTEPLLSGVAIGELPELVRGSLESAAANELLAVVVRCYRSGPRELWAPVLLEMLAPALLDMAAVLGVPDDSLLEPDDLYQQLVLETLDVAVIVRLGFRGRWLKLRMVKHVRKRLVRWLSRELAAVGAFESGSPELPIVAGGEFTPPADADLALLYRMKGLGATVEQIAQEDGTPVGTVRYRVRRARARMAGRRAA